MSNYKRNIVGWSVLLLCVALIAMWLIQQSLYFTALIVSVFLIFVFYKVLVSSFQLSEDVQKITAALVQKDYSQNVSELNLPVNLKENLQELQQRQQTIDGQIDSERKIFEHIIERIDTGIVIFKEIEKGTKNLFFVNNAFASLLEIPKFSKWDLVAEDLQTFDNYFNTEHWTDRKEIINLSINGKEQVFSLRTFLTKLYGHRYLIVNLDTLQSIVDRKEKEAWYNLMKVMSHEILNTITPINALSNNLEFLIEDTKNQLGENFSDIHKSVITIKERTTHLADFVETYRALTDLPSPQKEQVKIKEIIDQSLQVLAPMIQEKNITVSLNIKPVNLYFSVDKKQIEQVLINLITNSIYALDGVEEAEINIEAYEGLQKKCITIADNGVGIETSIKRDVFIPFFTTRENGAGIGLSLSKNIIQSHGGTIGFTSNGKETCFLIQF